jgi:hypothetical protein
MSQVTGREPFPVHAHSTLNQPPVGTLLKIYDKNILMIDSILSLKCFFDL